MEVEPKKRARSAGGEVTEPVMSSIEKLSIRGVRSFSPNREEIIEFYHPLTVILGDNGCGKTTIIECLKVATTGALPPGARSGQSFIHDPKIAGTNEVKARWGQCSCGGPRVCGLWDLNG